METPPLAPTNPPYSLAADWLSKFHTWPETVQALWVLAVAASVVSVILGTLWLVTSCVRDVLHLLPRRVGQRPRGRLVLALFEDPQGGWVLHEPGRAPRQLDARTVPKFLGIRTPPQDTPR